MPKHNGYYGAAADLSARTGSLRAAWGLHFANNTVALLILTTKETIPGLALFETPYTMDDPVSRQIMMIDIATLFVVWLMCRVLLRR